MTSEETSYESTETTTPEASAPDQGLTFDALISKASEAVEAEQAEAPVEATASPDKPDLVLESELKPVEDPKLLIDKLLLSNPAARQALAEPQASAPVAPQAAPVPQPQFIPSQPSQPQNLEQLFGEEGYDPYNPNHAAKILESEVGKALEPIKTFIEQFQQQEKTVQEQTYQAQVTQLQQEASDRILDLADKHLPGYSKLYGQNTVEAKAIIQTTEALWLDKAKELYPERLWAIPEVQKDITNRVMPEVKTLYGRLMGGSSKARLHVEGAASAPKGTGVSESLKKKAYSGDLDALEKLIQGG